MIRGAAVRAAAILAAVLWPAWAGAQPRQGTWFTPDPHARPALPTLDTSRPDPSTENITVLAKRPSRAWRAPPEAGLAPIASDVSRRPWSSKSFTPAAPYCNSTLRTIGGQPGSAADAMVGAGAGAC